MSRSDRPILVLRCVCTGHDFATASEVAAREGATTVAALQKSLPISTGCGLCIPYVQRTLDTGLTGHPVLDEGEVEGFLERSGLAYDEEEIGGRSA